MGIKSLIIDDEEEIRMMLKIILRKEGLDVDAASNLLKARILLRNNEYEFIFLDLNLPDGTGFELLEELNKQKIKTNAVIISAFDGWTEKNRAAELGAKAFVGKPFSKKEILNIISELN